MKKILLLVTLIISAGVLISQTLMPLPAHSSVYSGSARGYWFQSPTDFVITGLRVPSQAGTGLQYIHVMKFTAPPPAYSASTPPNPTLIFINGAPNGVIQNVNIPVATGEYIGILGTAGTANSYATGPYTSNINGYPVTLARLLYQGNLSSGPATAVSTENSSISRVEMYWELPVTAPNNIGVAAIDSPSVFCEGSQNIIATIKNYGTNQVTSAVVNWTLNTILQTPVAFSGLLDTNNGTGSTTAQVLLGSHLFGAGISEEVVAWTTLPNGQTDTINKNDTAMASLQPSLSGNFTIDPLGSGAYNYLTIGDAVNDLNTFGVCGPVNFAVAAGTYSEQMTLDEISGASATNTITFTADTGGVIVEYGPTSLADNWVLSLNKTSWVTLDGFTFQHSSGGSSSYRSLCLMDNGSSNNTFINNTFNFYQTTSSSSNLRGWTTNSAGNDYNKFINNTINNGGYYGFYFRGASTTSTNVGNEFDGNQFLGGYYYATYFYYGTDTKFRNNKVIANSGSSTTGYGLFMYYQYGATEVTGNYLEYSYYALRAYYWYGNQTDRGLIANNKVYSGAGTSTAYGAYCYYLEYTDVVHNTIWANSGPTSACYGVYAYYGSNNTFKNNVVYCPGGSASYYGIYCPSSTAYELDYNNVWTPTMNYGYYNGAQSNLAAWKLQGVGMHSHAADPAYPSKDSMITCLDTLDNNGTPVGIMYDYDGDNRHEMTPDIGADEFIGGDSSTFNAGPDGLLCNGNFIEIGVNVTGAHFIWSNLDTNGRIMVNTVGDYTVSVTSACGGSFTDVVTVTDNTPNAVFDYENSYYTGIFMNKSRTVGDLYRWVFYDDPNGKVNPTDTVWRTNQKNLTHLYNDNGPHYVCLTTYNECDTVEICDQWIGTVGIDESGLNNAISLIPNPVSDRLTVQFNNFSGDQINVEMTNVQGQVVYSDQFVNINSNGNRVINVSSLNKGMYIVKFTTENEVIAKQIIVQ